MKTTEQGLDRHRKIGDPLTIDRMEVRGVSLWNNPCLKGKARGKRREDQEMRRLQDHPLPRRHLLLNDIAVNTALLPLEIIERSPDLLLDPFGDDRKGHEMGVGMAVKNTRVILDDEELLKPLIPFEIPKLYPDRPGECSQFEPLQGWPGSDDAPGPRSQSHGPQWPPSNRTSLPVSGRNPPRYGKKGICWEPHGQTNLPLPGGWKTSRGGVIFSLPGQKGHGPSDS